MRNNATGRHLAAEPHQQPAAKAPLRARKLWPLTLPHGIVRETCRALSAGEKRREQPKNENDKMPRAQTNVEKLPDQPAAAPAIPVTQDSLKDIEKLEDSLWEAADNLRANSKLTS